MSAPKVPRFPGELGFTDSDFVGWAERLWRISRTTGPYAAPWSRPRAWGPVVGMRWDPHHPPASLQPSRSVLYAANSILTAAAETWQQGRIIRPRAGAPVVVAFTPTRPLRLLDLTARSAWPVRNQAGASLPHAPRPVCRRWSEAILDARPSLDGLLAPSTMAGLNVVLFPAGATAVPSESPDLIAPASDPAMTAVLQQVANQCGYRFDPT